MTSGLYHLFLPGLGDPDKAGRTGQLLEAKIYYEMMLPKVPEYVIKLKNLL